MQSSIVGILYARKQSRSRNPAKQQDQYQCQADPSILPPCLPERFHRHRDKEGHRKMQQTSKGKNILGALRGGSSSHEAAVWKVILMKVVHQAARSWAAIKLGGVNQLGIWITAQHVTVVT